MRNNFKSTDLFNKDTATDQNLTLIKSKTTNVNILLNRVREEEKNNLKKSIFFLSLLIFTLSVTIMIVIN